MGGEIIKSNVVTRRLQVDLKDLGEKIEELAKKEDRSLGAMCRVLISEALEARESEDSVNPSRIRRSLSSLPVNSLVALANESFQQALSKISTDEREETVAFLKKLAQGKRPTHAEMVRVAQLIGESPEAIMKLWNQ